MRRYTPFLFLAGAASAFLFFAAVAFAWIGPSATPPGGSGSLYLDSNANLGIGTTNPTPTNITTGRFFAVGTTTNPGLYLRDNDAGGGRYLIYVTSGGNLAFFDDTNNAERFYLATSGDIYAAGNIYASAFVGSLSGALSAANVSSGVFGSLQGNGAFAFPASLGISTSSQTGLPQPLSVYGNAYVSGNLSAGATSTSYKIDAQGGQINASGGFCIAGNCKTSWADYWEFSASSLYPTSTAYNVGVGTTTPAYKLTVSGGIYSTGSSTASAFCLSGTCQTSWSNLGQWTTATGGIYYPGNVSIGTTTVGTYPLYVSTSTDSLFAIHRNGATYPTIFKQGTDGVLVINNANTDTLTLKDGLVGVGTANPGQKLAVASSSGVSIDVTGGRIVNLGTPSGDLDAATKAYVDAAGGGANYWSLTGVDLYPTSTSYEVGIGTTTPGYALTVVGTSYFSQPVIVGTPTLSTHATTKSYVDTAIGASSTANYWALSGTSLYPTSTSYKVGIGTTTPSQALSLVGSFVLEPTVSSTAGVIYKGTSTFIHSFQHPTGATAIPVGNNVFIGANAGNFTMGSAAAQTYQASNNVAIGANAFITNTLGYYNVAIGESALRGNTTGNYNFAIGDSALRINTTGSYNSAVGSSALYGNTTASYNSTFGAFALFGNTTGYQNTIIGSYAGYSNSTGYFNAGIGTGALRGNTTGYYNSAIGQAAGRFITGGATANETSNTSIYLGGETKALASGDTNEIVIGYDATGIGSNSVVLGNSSITKTALMGNVGIATTTPAYKFEVRGTAHLVGTTTLSVIGLFVDASGKVGIGTTTQSYALTVLSSGGSAGYFNNPVYVGTPTVDGHAATKAYVDTAVGGGQYWELNGGTTLQTTDPSYDISFGDAVGTDLVVGSGGGKIDMGTVDPVYTIGGKRYATYMAGMTGVKEETTGVTSIKCQVSSIKCSAVLDFKNAKEGSDLWLFAKTTNIARNFDKMTVLLTPGFDGRAWYELDFENRTLAVFGEPSQSSQLKAQRSLVVSYRLTAPRFDFKAWPNASDATHEGFNLDKLIFETGEVDIQSLVTD